MRRLDNDRQIFFYENEFYIFSNYSSFALEWKGKLYSTSEAAYHSEKFIDEKIKEKIRLARSAHEAHKLAQANIKKRRRDWEDVKVSIMKEILRIKVEQHPYVKEKLLQSDKKELIEDSWRDDFWGWGLNRDGKNMLGKIWMEIREEYREIND